MAKKKFEPYTATEVAIVDIAQDGRAIGKHDERVIFVGQAVPGDLVDVHVYYGRRQVFDGRIEKFHKKSEHRAEPFCPHFGICGGCKWQHLAYPAQLIYKQKQVTDALERIGGVKTEGILNPIIGSEKIQFYRNKMEFTFSNKRWLTVDDMKAGNENADMDSLGFHVPGRFDKIVQVDKCFLQEDPSNAIRDAVGAYTKMMHFSYYDLKTHTGLMRNLIIRTSGIGEVMVIVVFAKEDKKAIDGLMTHLRETFPSLTSLSFVVNTKKNDTIYDQEVILFAGRDHIFEEMEGIRFKISPKSFYQTNSAQAYTLYKVAREFADLKGNELVYDLYTGAGTIANFIAPNAQKVVGIEYVPEAIADAKVNSELNGITNTVFFAGDMKDILSAAFIAEQGRPDVIITDPPRAGMHADVVARMMETGAKKIVYVSCNAATQARDLQLMADKYEVVKIQPVDMFPQTTHVENVVLLKLKA